VEAVGSNLAATSKKKRVPKGARFFLLVWNAFHSLKVQHQRDEGEGARHGKAPPSQQPTSAPVNEISQYELRDVSDESPQNRFWLLARFSFLVENDPVKNR
jgi:hypothetical protein